MNELEEIKRNLERLKKSKEVLSHVIEKTRAHGAFVMELAGEPLLENGEFEGNIKGLTMRVAAIWRESCEMAKVMGDSQFEEQAFWGGRNQLYVTVCGREHLLGVMFGNETNLGLVRIYGALAADHVASLVKREVADGEVR